MGARECKHILPWDGSVRSQGEAFFKTLKLNSCLVGNPKTFGIKVGGWNLVYTIGKVLKIIIMFEGHYLKIYICYISYGNLRGREKICHFGSCAQEVSNFHKII